MKIINYIKELLRIYKHKKEEKICNKSEHCPIHLAYLGKYGEGSKKDLYCKMPNIKYCVKYNLINPTLWDKMTEKEKIELVNEMKLIRFIDKNKNIE